MPTKQTGGGGGKKSRGKKRQGGGEKEKKRDGRKQTAHQAGREEKHKKERGPGGGVTERKSQGLPKPETTESKRQKKKEGERGGQQQDRKGATLARRGPSKAEGQSGHRKGEAHQNAPGRPARPTRPRRACTHTHTRDPSVASSDPKEEVSASTQNSSGAPTESPVKGRTVRETRHVSDWVDTRKPPQRTQPETDAGGTHQGQRHRGNLNGYDAERAQRPCLGRG